MLELPMDLMEIENDHVAMGERDIMVKQTQKRADSLQLHGRITPQIIELLLLYLIMLIDGLYYYYSVPHLKYSRSCYFLFACKAALYKLQLLE